MKICFYHSTFSFHTINIIFKRFWFSFSLVLFGIYHSGCLSSLLFDRDICQTWLARVAGTHSGDKWWLGANACWLSARRMPTENYSNCIGGKHWGVNLLWQRPPYPGSLENHTTVKILDFGHIITACMNKAYRQARPRPRVVPLHGGGARFTWVSVEWAMTIAFNQQ